jgi:hypothetical protein
MVASRWGPYRPDCRAIAIRRSTSPTVRYSRGRTEEFTVTKAAQDRGVMTLRSRSPGSGLALPAATAGAGSGPAPAAACACRESPTPASAIGAARMRARERSSAATSRSRSAALSSAGGALPPVKPGTPPHWRCPQVHRCGPSSLVQRNAARSLPIYAPAGPRHVGADAQSTRDSFRVQVGHLALSRSPMAASRASATILAWSKAVNLPARRRMRPSTITVSTFVGSPNETIAS